MRTISKKRGQPLPNREVCPNLKCCRHAVPAFSDFHLKRILVPVDFSACSSRALEYAVPFAKLFGAQIIFLHVLAPHYDLPWAFEMDGYDPLQEDELRARMKKQLAAWVQKCGPSGVQKKLALRRGATSIEIINAARDENVGMIIMSTRGRTGRIHSLVGSVAADVTRLTPCPVLVVHGPGNVFSPSPQSKAPSIQAHAGAAGAIPP